MTPVRSLLPLLLAALLPLTACSKGADGAAPAPVKLAPGAKRTAAPAWTLPGVGPMAKPVSLADYKGKIVVLNFWGTWCPPCLAEMPEFAAAQKAYADKGVQFIGLSLDAVNPLQGDLDQVPRMAKTAGVTYPIALATQRVLDLYGGVEVIPTTFFIDAEGRIALYATGMLEGSDLNRALAALLKDRDQAQAGTAAPAKK
ncbi:cytochrome c biogenesis protein CcmG, thiol:disulfide interchange protein DsbE [Verrucomicrobium sp. GAS474]|uniref:TlpA family protein disulfide reductase n=1 Tax=Verrucomicrobium sp. GAS474 TaxID=1882831 RepID=UPI00087A5376|nr:TlpA disulfide reductase family protein [Verrucomicrobium sp. GAS474]SDT92124.1 cytochrome c biogenesis protein CcmG, thiol:disulfide interchange protein DsbE [Verrucomicrobium sp. GAS474]